MSYRVSDRARGLGLTADEIYGGAPGAGAPAGVEDVYAALYGGASASMQSMIDEYNASLPPGSIPDWVANLNEATRQSTSDLSAAVAKRRATSSNWVATNPLAFEVATLGVGTPILMNLQQHGKLAGLGALGDPAATDGDKARMSQNAVNIFEMSKSNPGDPSLPGWVSGSLAELDSYAPWSDTSGFLGLFTDSWVDSQTVRSNLQQALANSMIANGKTGPDWRPQTTLLTPVDVTAETVANFPGALVDQTKQTGCGIIPGAVWDDATQSCKIPSLWDSIPSWLKIGGGLLLGSTALFYGGDFIKAAGHVVEKVTR